MKQAADSDSGGDFGWRKEEAKHTEFGVKMETLVKGPQTQLSCVGGDHSLTALLGAPGMSLSEDMKDEGLLVHTEVSKPTSHLFCLTALLQTAVGVFHLAATHIRSSGQ